MFLDTYYKEVLNLIHTIFDNEKEVINKAGLKVAEAIKKDKLIHVFGCGHSHMLAEELFYRAGGLAPISPIFDTSVMLHTGAQKSSSLEKKSGLAQLTISDYKIEEGDIIIIASNSGINSYPIEMGIEAKKKGAYAIGIVSEAYKDKPSRHVDNLHLTDVCDLTINNHVTYGDASIEVGDSAVKAGPLSSLSLFYIVNSLMLTTCEYLIKDNIIPPIFTSGNVPEGEVKNQKLIDKYKYRVKHL